jgi:hypothetical protein
MRPWGNGILFLKRDGAFCVDSPSFSWGQRFLLGSDELRWNERGLFAAWRLIFKIPNRSYELGFSAFYSQFGMELDVFMISFFSFRTVSESIIMASS